MTTSQVSDSSATHPPVVCVLSVLSAASGPSTVITLTMPQLRVLSR